jgi:hypothetical protein
MERLKELIIYSKTKPQQINKTKKRRGENSKSISFLP